MIPSDLRPEPAQLAEIAEIVAQYGRTLRKLENHRKVCLLETDAGYKYLKRTKLAPDDLRFIAEALTYLSQQGFQTVPLFDPGPAGEPFVEHGPDRYIMTDWFFSRELDFEAPEDLRLAIRYLADFHRCGAGFSPQAQAPARSVWLNWPAKLEARLRQMEDFRRLAFQEKEHSEFSRLYLRHFEPFYRQGVKSLEALLRSAYPEVSRKSYERRDFCHHDYSGRNVLQMNDGGLALVDFDYCLQDLRVHDLINLLVRNLKYHDWDPELGRFIVAEYHSGNALAPDETEVLHILLCWPQEFWQVGLQYYYEKLPWPKERFLKKLRRKVIYRHERNRFLNVFPLENGVFRWKPAL